MQPVQLNVFSSSVESNISRLKQIYLRKAAISVMAIRMEITNSYRQVAQTVFENVFNEQLGKEAYDVNSLKNSITVLESGDTHRFLIYDISKFKWEDNYAGDGKFNQNTSSQSNVREFENEDDAAYSILDDVFLFNNYDDRIVGRNEEDILAYSSFNNFYQESNAPILDKNKMMGIEKVYKLAIQRVEIAWNKEYQLRVKPQLEKKYGISLDV